MDDHLEAELPTGVLIDDEDIIRVVLEHLRRRGHIEAMRALERETGVEADVLGEDAAFLRTLVMDGRWDETITLLEPLRKSAVVLEKACFEVRKQEFLEMLEEKAQGDKATTLVKALQRLESGCSQKEFNDLCFCLTLPGVRSHPDYTSWSPHVGRLWCFEALREYLGILFPGQEVPVETVPEGQLELLCQQACLYQAEEARRVDSSTRFSSSAVGGLLSKTWKPKASAQGIRKENGVAANGKMARGEVSSGPPLAPGDGLSKSQPLGFRRVMSGMEDNELVPATGNADASARSDTPTTAAAAAAAAVRNMRRSSISASSPSSSAQGVNHGGTHSITNLNGSNHRKPQRPLSHVLAYDPVGGLGGGGGGGGSVRDSAGGGGGSIWSSPSAHGSSPGWSGDDQGQAGAGAGGSNHHTNGFCKTMNGTRARSTSKERSIDQTRDGGADDIGRISREGSRHSFAGSVDLAMAGTKKSVVTPGSPPSGEGSATVGSSGAMSASTAPPSGQDFVNTSGGVRRTNGSVGVGGAGPSSSTRGATPSPSTMDLTPGWASIAVAVDNPDAAADNDGSGGSSSNGCDESWPPAARGRPPLGHSRSATRNERTSNATGGSSTDAAQGVASGTGGTPNASRSPKRRTSSPVAWEINLPNTTGLGQVPPSSASTAAGVSAPTAPPGPLSAAVVTCAPTPPAAGSIPRERGRSAEPSRRIGNMWSGGRESGAEPSGAEGGGGGLGFGSLGLGGLVIDWQRGTTRRLMLMRQRSRSLSPTRPSSLEPGTSNRAMERGRRVWRPEERGRSGNREGDNVGDSGGVAAGRSRRQESDLSPRPSDGGDEAEGLHGGGSEASWKGRGPGGGCGSSWKRWRAPSVLAEQDAPRFISTVVLRGTHPIRAVSFSPDGWLFAAGDNNRALRVCRAPMEDEVACAVEVSDERGGLQVVESREVLRRDFLHRGSIYCVGFSPDSSLIATGSNDKSIRILQMPPLGIETASPMAPTEVNASPSYDDNGSEGGTTREGCRAGGGATGTDNGLVPESTEGLMLRGHTGTIRDLCFPWTEPPNIPSIVPGTSERNATSKAVQAIPPPRTSSRLSTEASMASRLLSVGAGDFACRVWDVEGGVISGGGGGGGIGAGSGDNSLSPLVVFRGHKSTVFSCTLLPGGEIAVTGGADSVVRVWDARTGASVRTLPVDNREVLCVRPWPRDPDRLVATSHADGSCFLWDLKAGRAISTLIHHTDQTRSLDFSIDGSSLLTASYDGLTGVSRCRGFSSNNGAGSGGPRRPVHSWNLLRGNPRSSGTGGNDDQAPPAPGLSLMASLRAHRGRVLQACWRPTGPPAFLTSSTDCCVLLWSLPQEEEQLGE